MINVDANSKEGNKDLTLIKKCCQKNMSDYFNIRTVWYISSCFSLISPQIGHCALPCPGEANKKLYLELNFKERIAIVLIISHPVWVPSYTASQALMNWGGSLGMGLRFKAENMVSKQTFVPMLSSHGKEDFHY